MHYYKRHLGDYARDTGHLSALEHGVYNLLLDNYYSREQAPTKAEAVRFARARTTEELAAVDAVLDEFFMLEGDRYLCGRVEEELAGYREVAETNRRIAVQREERKRARSVHEACTNGSESVNLASNHKPVTIEAKATVEPTTRQRATATLFDEFWSAYPNKQGKQEAAKRWKRDGLDAMADTILAHVAHMRANDDGWLRGFAPMGSTYLNQARWTDEARPAPLVDGQATAPAKERVYGAAAAMVPTESKADRDRAYQEHQRRLGLNGDAP